MKIHETYAYLRVKDAGAAIDYYKRAFGVREKFRLVEPSGPTSQLIRILDRHPEIAKELQ